jgi:hypothetical protein
MSQDCSLIAGNEVRRPKEAARNAIYEDEEFLDEPERASKECAICGELVNQACLLFIGRKVDGQDLFACSKCCNSGSSED